MGYKKAIRKLIEKAAAKKSTSRLSIEESATETLLERKASEIQTIILSKSAFRDSKAARAWARDHDFGSAKIDETGESFRLRQREPSEFSDRSFRTIDIAKGVKAVIGRPKGTKMSGSMLLPYAGEAFSKQGGDEFSKDVLRVGKWTHPDTGEVVDITPERLRKIYENSNRYLGVVGSVPFPDGHRWDAVSNLGHWPGPYVLLGDRLFSRVKATEPRARDMILNGTLRGVSAVLSRDRKDQAGNTYDEVITHICATDYPVVTDQGSFVPLGSDPLEEAVVLRPAESSVQGSLDAFSTALAVWDPTKHPRDEAGRWSEGGLADELTSITNKKRAGIMSGREEQARVTRLKKKISSFAKQRGMTEEAATKSKAIATRIKKSTAAVNVQGSAFHAKQVRRSIASESAKKMQWGGSPSARLRSVGLSAGSLESFIAQMSRKLGIDESSHPDTLTRMGSSAELSAVAGALVELAEQSRLKP
ncbi:MAG: hypothetical protein LLG93_07625 [Deltaproteobacteria bacterium]|nr:hypothetical protein [Deltaproteobacteria bacterium]